MPKQRIDKDTVVHAAFELARAKGLENVTVKDIASMLNCSVQPIYSYCRSMDGLRNEVCRMAVDFVREYVAARTDKKDLFRSTGRAYVRLAGEEGNILRMFIFRRRENISGLDELYASETDPRLPAAIAAQLGLSVENARRLHLNMLVYTLGLCAIFSVTSPELPVDEIYRQQEMAFDAFLSAAREEEKHGE